MTDCLHLYCKDCLTAMDQAAAENGENNASCVECGHTYAESRPCSGLVELDMPDGLISTSQRSRQRCTADEGLKWMSIGGNVLRSSKTAAVQAQIEKWLKKEPGKKIIIFSQFRTLYVFWWPLILHPSQLI